MRNQPTEEPKEDLRQRRTKKLLTEALLALMEERPFSEISVVDICQRAMIHRTTFYAHFEDKYALLRYAVARLYRAFEPTAEDLRANPRSYLLSVFQNSLSFVRAHKGLYRSAVSSGSMDIQTLEDLVAEQLLSRLPADEAHPARAEITAHFYAGGILSLVRWWIERDTNLSEEALLQQMDQAGLFPELSSQKG